MTPTKNEYCTANFDFAPQDDSELEFKRGNKILIIDKSDANWWKGSLDNKEGWFPSNYVKFVPA